MTKIKPIVRGNIVVWPVIPNLTAGVKLHDQSPRNASPENVAVIPVVRIDRHSADLRAEIVAEAKYNDIQDIIAKTMRGQRAIKHNPHVMKKLRAMFKYPA